MPKGEFNPCKKDRSRFRDAVAICVTQQCDTVSTRYTCPSPFHKQFHDPALNAFVIFGLGWSIGFGNQYIAIGKNIQPARVVKVSRKGGHRKARALPLALYLKANFWPGQH